MVLGRNGQLTHPKECANANAQVHQTAKPWNTATRKGGEHLCGHMRIGHEFQRRAQPLEPPRPLLRLLRIGTPRQWHKSRRSGAIDQSHAYTPCPERAEELARVPQTASRARKQSAHRGPQAITPRSERDLVLFIELVLRVEVLVRPLPGLTSRTWIGSGITNHGKRLDRGQTEGG
jgi:hypothetical protein